MSDKINAMKSGAKPNDRAVSINDKPASNNSAAATQPAGKEVEVPEDDDDDLEGIRAQLDTAKNAIRFWQVKVRNKIEYSSFGKFGLRVFPLRKIPKCTR